MRNVIVEYIASAEPQEIPFGTIAPDTRPFIREWKVWITIHGLLEFMRQTGDPRTSRVTALRAIKACGMESRVHGYRADNAKGKKTARFYGAPVEWYTDAST